MNVDSTTKVGKLTLTQLIDVYIARLQREYQCLDLRNDETCMVRESKRPLSTIEHDRGWPTRPFHAYYSQFLCVACGAHWHASMSRKRLTDAINMRGRKDRAAAKVAEDRERSLAWSASLATETKEKKVER